MAKTLEQTVQDAVQSEIGRLTVQTILLTAALAAANEEIAALKAEIAKNAKQADNTAESGPRPLAAVN